MGRRKRGDEGEKSSGRVNRLARVLLATSGAILLTLVGGSALLTPDCEQEGCPTLATVERYRPPEPPRVFDRNGAFVGQLAGPRRLVVTLDRISPLLRNGFVAVEDRRFFRHDGVDVVGLVRAATRNVRAGRIEEGASTITMQLVRNVFEADVHQYNRWRRKLTEVRMAIALEDRLSKDRILELYLNQIYLGGGVWGVETAARHLFGKSAADVTPAEAALIVGLAKNPEGYNPRRNPEAALRRRSVVLDVFRREGLLTGDAAEAAREQELRLVPARDENEVAGYFFAAVDRRLRELFPNPGERAGLRIHTTYDPETQEAAHGALRDRIRAIEAGASGPYEHPAPRDTAADALGSRAGGGSPYLQGMVVALDPRSGAVRALVGGRDIEHSEFDRALQARRQPGSAFKPFVYAAALESGLTLADRIPTDPVVVRQVGRPVWRPRDSGDGEPLTVRGALARSSNTASVRIGMHAGLRAVTQRAIDLGVAADLPEYPSVLLGAAEVVPIDLVAAYAAFGNGGRRVRPHLVTRIEDEVGRLLWAPDDLSPVPVLSPAVAYLTLDAMRSVVDRGTGRGVRAAGYYGPAAGKTGTTDGGKDAWFVGLTPDLVAGVWIGFDTPRSIVPGASGGALAAPVWGRLMAETSGRSGSRGRWSKPQGVIEALIDVETGTVATPHCPEEVVQRELFLLGTEPAMQCPVHRPAFFRRVVGGLKRLLGIGR